MSTAVTSAGPLVTDERLAALAPWVPLLMAALLVLAFFWADRGKPWAADDDGPETSTMPDWAPPTAPELSSLTDRLRAADRS